MPKPTLFIGSSSESLPVVELLAAQLSKVAKVTPWSNKEFFTPGLYYLDNLIHKLPEFDFAIFIFGQDDVVTSRGTVKSAPRDNVIFEFGYALARLGRERVFHLVPKGKKVDVKVMSDLSGMKPWEYQLPNKSRRFRHQLQFELQHPCRFIAETVKSLGPRPRFDRGVEEGPQYVMDVYDDILQAFRKKGRNEVKNIALDMEQTWPAVRDRFILDRTCPRTTWQSLLIDPQSPIIKRLEGPSFSTTIATAMIENMRTVLKTSHRPKSAVTYQCRAYNSAPSIHGFLVNDSVAFISLCGLSPKWADGTSSPYLSFHKGKGIKAADHMVDSFLSLFNYHWKQARPVWPTR